MNSRRTGQRRFFGILALLVGVGLLGVGLLAVAVHAATGFLRVGRDADALRETVLNSFDGEVTKLAEGSVGDWSMRVVRLASGFVEMDARAEQALRAIRGLEAAVYQVEQIPHAGRGKWLEAAHQTMSTRGWTRLVGVINDDACVGLFVPQEIASEQDVRVCAVVMADDHLVFASGRCNMRPLAGLVTMAMQESGTLRRLGRSKSNSQPGGGAVLPGS